MSLFSVQVCVLYSDACAGGEGVNVILIILSVHARAQHAGDGGVQDMVDLGKPVGLPICSLLVFDALLLLGGGTYLQAGRI